MDPAAPNGRRVLVRLSDVPRDLRVAVADTIIEKGKLRGIEAADLMLVAYSGKPDAKIFVSPEKADRVIRQGKQPQGGNLKVWAW